jgi:hypothetical protein
MGAGKSVHMLTYYNIVPFKCVQKACTPMNRKAHPGIIFAFKALAVTPFENP